MHTLLRGCFAVSLFLVADVWAQDTYQSRSNIYRFSIPYGWSVVSGSDVDEVSDVAIAPPGGIGRGSIYVTLSNPRGTLDDDAAYVLGSEAITTKEMVTVDRFSCLHVVAISGRGNPTNVIFCQFTVPFSDGPSRASFMLGQSLHPDAQTQQDAIFWEVARSLQFSPETTE
jgi:hypothetical protein